MGVYSESDTFKRFRSWVALQRTTVSSNSEKTWKFYDYGPRDSIPLVCIPGVTGTAECFYRQMVQAPAYSSHRQWVKGFDRFLDSIKVDKVHLLGATLGGYLAQCYIQYRPHRVLSLILSNSYCDITYFSENSVLGGVFSWVPGFVLKRIVLSNFPEGVLEAEIANSVDFMVEQLEAMGQKELASRLSLNSMEGPLKPEDLPITSDKITIIDTMDEMAVPEKLREEVVKFFPSARRALLKSGGNFPYLSRADEFNMYVEVHLKSQKYKLDEEKAPASFPPESAAQAPAAAPAPASAPVNQPNTSASAATSDIPS